MRNHLMLFVALSLTACAGRQAIVTTPPARCVDLVPAGWAKGVEAAPIPNTTAPAGSTPLDAAIYAAKAWANAYVGMSGQLDKSNARTIDAIEIVRQCEAKANLARSAK